MDTLPTKKPAANNAHRPFMKRNSIDLLRQQLFEESSGIKFSKLKDKLIKTCVDAERELVITILIQYVKEGQILHWRNFLLTDLIDIIHEKEKQYAAFFEWTITVPTLTYWGIDGLLKTKGKDSYEELIEVITTEDLPLSIRAKGIKSISEFSKQTFDKGLPSDPGYWEVEDLKVADILEWQKNGYPNGFGYERPKIHPSLNNPKTELEKLVSKLDSKLQKSRSENQDLANPSNWLVIASETDISEIKKKWTLPEKYLLFLKNYSPLRVQINSKKFVNELSLDGASDLIEGQNGYSYDGVPQKTLNDWPTNFVVIGNDGGDPFCVDISAVSNGDAPIYTSMHGQGVWEFELFADSFIKFLKSLT